MDTTSPLSPDGKLVLNAMLGTMKVKGVLTDEMISQEEGEIILSQPFQAWPKDLQEKLTPYGASPAIR
jgi:hypothetical protein